MKNKLLSMFGVASISFSMIFMSPLLCSQQTQSYYLPQTSLSEQFLDGSDYLLNKNQSKLELLYEQATNDSSFKNDKNFKMKLNLSKKYSQQFLIFFESIFGLMIQDVFVDNDGSFCFEWENEFESTNIWIDGGDLRLINIKYDGTNEINSHQLTLEKFFNNAPSYQRYFDY